MKKTILKVILALLTIAAPLPAQIIAPNPALSGTTGPGGSFQFLVAGSIKLLSDANHTLVYPETVAYGINFTTNSGVTLTATRTMTGPLIPGIYAYENSTAGGQNLIMIGTSGLGVPIPNGVTVIVYCDGTNYILLAQYYGLPDNQTCTSTCTLSNITHTNHITLSGNVTSSTLPAASDGFCTNITVVQASSGGPYMFAWPTNVRTTIGVPRFASYKAAGTWCYSTAESIWYAPGPGYAGP